MLRRSRIVPADGLRQSSEASEGTAIRCPRWALLLIPMVFLLPVLGVGLFLLPERREQQHDVSSPQSKASELTSVRALLGSASVAVPPAVRRVVAAAAQLPPQQQLGGAATTCCTRVGQTNCPPCGVAGAASAAALPAVLAPLLRPAAVSPPARAVARAPPLEMELATGRPCTSDVRWRRAAPLRVYGCRLRARYISLSPPIYPQVRGNLGPASTVTSAVSKDWLKDRWQGAKDMSGAPIPGPHSLVIDLQRRCRVTRAKVDFETAYAAQYDVELSDGGVDGPWRLLHAVESAALPAADVSKRGQHVVHRFATPSPPGDAARWVRLHLKTLATGWGVSVWRVELWGSEVSLR